jgi:hypothetical protein
MALELEVYRDYGSTGKVCCYAAITVRVYRDATFTLAREDTLAPPGGVALAEVKTQEV